MVDKIQTQIEELETELQIERSKRTQNTEELASLEKQIEEVDKQYTDEDQLETIEMLCKCGNLFCLKLSINK